MSERQNLQQLVPVLARPYTVTQSRLGTITKVFEDTFLCTVPSLHTLQQSIEEKLGAFRPSSYGFQYLISFSDKTHYENEQLESLERVVENSSKKTDRLILKWAITHDIDGIDNDLTVTVRITNPINPWIMLQAAMSKSTEDIDNLDFARGAVSVAAEGASQITAEEIFSIVGKWIDSRPQPQYIIGFHKLIERNQGLLAFMNSWLLPSIFVIAAYFFLLKLQTPYLVPATFLALVGHTYLRSIANAVNRHIGVWAMTSSLFSIFQLTGGDSNQLAKFASRSRNSTLKLAATVVGSFTSNVGAGILAAWLWAL